jgi:hypothetical protein
MCRFKIWPGLVTQQDNRRSVANPSITTVNLYDCRLTLGDVCSSPFSGKLGCSQELLSRVLFVHVLFRESGSCDDLGQDPGTGEELNLGKPRVVDESFRLQSQEDEMSVTARGIPCASIYKLTHSPANILLARYIPIAAITLGLARRNRWSSRVTSIKYLDKVLVCTS